MIKYNFVLYSNNIEGIKEYEKGIKLEEPIKLKMFGVYKHSFGCSLSKAITQWGCIKQILKFERFYHSIYRSKKFEAGTKFNILLFPIVYLYSLIDTKMFHRVKFV